MTHARPAAHHVTRTPHPARTAALVAGVLMAVYLLLRPYGDAPGATPEAAAAAFASPLWVASHVAGAVALAASALVMAQIGGRLARPAALAGAAGVLPYYGAETFGLHAIGQRVLAGDAGAFELVAAVRDQPVALTGFAGGLLLLAVAGILAARAHRGAALWPLGLGLALVLPQFFLPPVGRMAFGVAYLAAALVFVVASGRPGRVGVVEPALEPVGDAAPAVRGADHLGVGHQ